MKILFTAVFVGLDVKKPDILNLADFREVVTRIIDIVEPPRKRERQIEMDLHHFIGDASLELKKRHLLYGRNLCWILVSHTVNFLPNGFRASPTVQNIPATIMPKRR